MQQRQRRNHPERLDLNTPKHRPWNHTRILICAAAIGAAVVVLPARRAHAEINLGTYNGWTLSTDGRVNNFFSFASGDWLPTGEPSTYTGLDEAPTANGKIISTRVRSGFIMNVLAFELNKQLTQGGTSLKVRVALWSLTASLRSAFDAPQVEARETFFKLEGNWGGLLVGRSLALFARGGILLDYDVQHGTGLGYPCGTKEVHGGSCGHAGFGLLFPGFHSGFVYNTPNIGGLQLSVGLYDPVQYTSADYRRTPYPRPEAEITYSSPKKYVTAFVGGLWQRLSATLTNPNMGPGQPPLRDFNFESR
jgi:hypothetical protein